MRRLSHGTEGHAHEGNLHSHHEQGKLLLVRRKHTGKCMPWPWPGTETLHIQLQTYNTLGSMILACTALKCPWLILEPAVLLCLSAGHAAWGRGTAPSTSSKRKCRQWIELSWSRGRKTPPVPAWVQRGLARVTQRLLHPSAAVGYHIP